MAKSSRIRKSGRIKKEISEWDAFWEQHPGILGKSASWHDCKPEVLHIAIALQKNEPGVLLIDMEIIKDKLQNSYGINWKGNLSQIFRLISSHKKSEKLKALFEIFQNTSFNEPFKCLLTTYNKFAGIKVPEGNLYAHRIVYTAYRDIGERKKDTSLLCKFILTKYLIGEEADPSGLLKNNERNDILQDENIPSITALWLPVSNDYKIIDTNFSDFIWDYNIKHLPFIVEPDTIISKREAKNFNYNRMNVLKEKADNLFIEFKKIDLLQYCHKYVAEIFMGFIGRIHYFTLKIIEQEERNEGEIAESTLRLLYETRVKFLWLNNSQSSEAIQKFREYKVGREKLFVDYVQENGKDNPDFDKVIESMNTAFNKAMQSEGMDDYKIATEKGDAFEKNLAVMAKELGRNEEMSYVMIYKRTSDIIHGNWRILEKYHLERSLNPAQDNLLRYKTTQNSYAGLLPSFIGLMLAIDTLIKFFDYYDDLLNPNKKLYNSLKRFHKDLNKRYLKEFSQKTTE